MSRADILLPAQPEIGFYGELDPFAGGISSSLADLPRLVRELSLFLLVKDLVLLSPGTLLEHALTLAAAERLAPFVRAGRLTTTTSSSISSPGAMIEARVVEYVEELGRERRRNIERARRTELSEVRERWLSVLPDTWSLRRDVDAQVAGFADSVMRHCREAAGASRAATRLLGMLEESSGAGASLNRNVVLAHVAALRGSALPRELARFAFVVQAAFYAFGVGSHEQCVLYPGAFARLLRRAPMGNAGEVVPPVDWEAEPSRVAERLLEIGIDVERLLALPAEELVSVAGSRQWGMVRALIRGSAPSAEVARACASLFAEHRDPTDALAKLPAVLDVTTATPRFPARWQLGVSASLGVVGLAQAGERRETHLDVARGALSWEGRERRLSMTQLHLVTVLAGAGEAGLSCHDLETLTAEVDYIEAAADGRGGWREGRAQDGEAQSEARALRVRVLIRRINLVLEPFSLRVASRGGRGRYRILDGEGRPRPLHLRGTLWTLLDRQEVPVAPAGFSVAQATLWRALVESAPFALSVQQLAAALDKPADERGLKQVTDAMARLRRKIERAEVPWRLVRLGRGIYALLPKRSALPSEVV